ncbi:MAG: alpha/beta hydrolase [Acaryochloris sp. RU_4_1]|nr:alpha/beta hydrolase [Acaryochloris sp. RU_4_1]NJR53866.1 alpha/beta hydrolase [Acaryochloris sp. CRU_2_0]
MTASIPEYLLFVQHGWADTNGAMARLAQRVAPANTRIIAPNLGWWRTWVRIEPLVRDVEAIAQQTLLQYPQTPVRIIGHSMGGLIWLEVLHRHPDWWSRVESLVLVGSPVSGSDLCRLMDPFAAGLGIAADLGKNRRSMASAIAAHIPTLSIASTIDGGSDGLIMRGATQFDQAHWLEFPDIVHAAQRNATAIDNAIREFWHTSPSLQPFAHPVEDITAVVINHLRNVPGMTDGHTRYFGKANLWTPLTSKINLLIWKNVLQVDHVFLGSTQGDCVYSGFVGWLHRADLYRCLHQIRNDYGSSVGDLG